MFLGLPHRLEVATLQAVLHQEAVNITSADTAIQLRLLQKQLTLPG